MSFIVICRHFFLTLSLMQLRAAWQVENVNQKESSRKNVSADDGSSEGEQEKFLLPLSLFLFLT